MKTCVILIAALSLAMPAAVEAATKRHRRAPAQPQQQIACTVLGCVPVPPGCGQTPGKTFGGSPTGGDVIVCPPGVAPFR